MTHPLTEKTSDKLYEEFVDSNFSHWDNVDFLIEDGFITTQNLMQIGADWQLRQVTKWLSEQGYYFVETDDEGDFSGDPESTRELLVRLKKAMRPEHVMNNKTEIGYRLTWKSDTHRTRKEAYFVSRTMAEMMYDEKLAEGKKPKLRKEKTATTFDVMRPQENN